MIPGSSTIAESYLEWLQRYLIHHTHQGRRELCVQFRSDVATVHLDRFCLDPECMGYLFTLAAKNDLSENLGFSRRQLLQACVNESTFCANLVSLLS